jgi:uncharacterized protein YoxC
MKLTATVFMLTGVLALQAMATDPTPTPTMSGAKSCVEQLVSETSSAETKAAHIVQALKKKNADPADLTGQFAEISQSVSQIQSLVSQIEIQTGSMNAKQLAEFNGVKGLANLMSVFLNNKQNLINSGDLAANRDEFRAHALSAAIRAELIRKNAAKLRI